VPEEQFLKIFFVANVKDSFLKFFPSGLQLLNGFLESVSTYHFEN
jgi:hypothetical protein